ncbi:MAG TPA: DinB family protein [Dehalococcoidales bacterium]|nr:MAG: hypothetical protein A2Z05_03735 [Chloroflexi bacterium RBG_16_60_22]HJX13043.1 DinB family protein [Dehalococcoidales bacterium]
MDWQELISGAYGSIGRNLERALEGLKKEDLGWQPHPESNSIGWLVWHLTRVQDALISGVMGQEQLWLKDGWHKKFGRPAQAGDAGVGHKPEEVAAFKSPGAATLLGYNRAVLERSQRFFPTLSSKDLDRTANLPMFDPPPTNGRVLLMVLDDNIQHVGQVAYIRGQRQGRGWMPH